MKMAEIVGFSSFLMIGIIVNIKYIRQNLEKLFNYYAIIALMIGFLVLGFNNLFFLLILVLISITLNQFKNKKMDKSSMVALVLAVLPLFVHIYNNITHHVDIIKQKEQLYQITGIIPEKPAKIYVGRHHEYFLTVSDRHFTCGQTKIRDTCQLVYAHHGKSAIIYYQYANNNHHRAYEIIIDDKVIYSFDEQVVYFLNQEKSIRQIGYWQLGLYGLPITLFLVLILIKNRQYQDDESKSFDDTMHFWIKVTMLLSFGVVAGLGYYLMNF